MPTFDFHWHGAPGAMSEALTGIGWAPAGTEPAGGGPPHIIGIVGPVVAEYQGAITWTALIRATQTLAYPAGVGQVPADMAPDPRVALGTIAAISARVISASDFLARFTPEETAALWTADARLMAGAMKVLAQGSANLDSAEAQQLMALAVGRGVLSEARAAAILGNGA